MRGLRAIIAISRCDPAAFLGQAAWASVRLNPGVRRVYNRLVAKNPKKRKIAIVAVMRRLAIHLWHRALEAHGEPTPAAAPQS